MVKRHESATPKDGLRHRAEQPAKSYLKNSHVSLYIPDCIVCDQAGRLHM